MFTQNWFLQRAAQPHWKSDVFIVFQTASLKGGVKKLTITERGGVRGDEIIFKYGDNIIDLAKNKCTSQNILK